MPETSVIPFKKRFQEGFRVYDSSRVTDRHILTLSSKKSERSRPSAHVKFEKVPGLPAMDVRGIVFGTRSKRIVDAKIHCDAIEILTAFDIKRWRDCTNGAFAESQGVEVGLENKFIRIGRDLILLFKNEDGKVVEFCIRLDADLRKRMDMFLQTGVADPRK